MLVRQERIAFLLLCFVSVSIIATTFILSGIDKSILASDYTPRSDEGSLVHLEGEIKEVHTTKTGGHILATINGTAVFIPATIAGEVVLLEGDYVSLYGLVQTYQGEREVVLNSLSDITILNRR